MDKTQKEGSINPIVRCIDGAAGSGRNTGVGQGIVRPKRQEGVGAIYTEPSGDNECDRTGTQPGLL